MSMLRIDFSIDDELHTFVELEVPEEDAMLFADAISDQIVNDYPDQVVEDEDDDEDSEE